MGLRPATQFTGQGDETLTLWGTLFPAFTGGTFSLEALQLRADPGIARPMIEGTGFIYALFVITALSKMRKLFSLTARHATWSSL